MLHSNHRGIKAKENTTTIDLIIFNVLITI